MKKIIAIIGPTASGKTGIGVDLAKDFNGEIISADSRQVFRGLNLGTGKEGFAIGEQVESRKLKVESHPKFISGSQLTPKQVRNDSKIETLRNALRFVDNVPQWLIDIKEPGEDFHLFEFLELAKLVIEDIQSRGKLPIIVGGTGLYVQGLVEGFQLVESRKSKVESDRKVILNLFRNLNNNSEIKREYSRTELESLTREELQEVLQELDPKASEKVDQNNPHRLIRAIERAQEGTEMIKVKPDYQVLQIWINSLV